jgi:hypothetical protein
MRCLAPAQGNARASHHNDNGAASEILDHGDIRAWRETQCSHPRVEAMPALKFDDLAGASNRQVAQWYVSIVCRHVVLPELKE